MKEVFVREVEDKVEDMVHQPSHYSAGQRIECIEAIEYLTEGMTAKQAISFANVVKYIWRCNDKNGMEDLAKAKNYLHRFMTGEWER